MREETVEQRLLWLAAVISMPRWRAAARMASNIMRKVAGFAADDLLQAAGTMSLDERSQKATVFSERMRVIDPVLALTWRLLALRTSDGPMIIKAAVAGAVALLSHADGDTTEAQARLRVWDDVALGKYDGAAYDSDFFQIADRYWRGERQRIVADAEDDARIVSGIPACIELIEHDRWDDALSWLCRTTEVSKLGVELPNLQYDDRNKQSLAIRGVANLLFAQRRPWCGELALAWLMLLCDPKRPASFDSVLPQVAWMIDHWSIITNPAQKSALQDRIEMWWRAARGEWSDSDPPVSIFRIAAVETAGNTYGDDGDGDPDGTPAEPPVEEPKPLQPSVVVMPGKLAEERGLPTGWREMRDQALPLVVCENATAVRETLREEYPHAWREIGLLTQDLRDGQRVRMRPTLLVSQQPGMGKSRLVRRLASLIGGGMYVYRYDGAAAHDGTYAGSSKSWSSAQPSVPARAIMTSKTANPICMVDEIDRAGASTYNGNLWSAMAPFLEIETAARYRETGLDAELDLSHVIHMATANSVDRLPSHLRDRYRVIRIPSPTLAHLPALATQVMRDLAAEDEARSHDPPLADDELAVIGHAWAKQKFSIRKLQRLISATLDIRDAIAPRH